MDTSGIKRYSLSQQVVDKLEQLISSGHFKVGEKINSESELMTMFNVSRNTLREAIHALTVAGVLEVKQGDGTYVRSSNRFYANMKKEYDTVSLEDIKETRNALEITMANLAAKNATSEDIKEIEEALNNRRMLKGSARENTKTDMEFHLRIARASHNKVLIDLYMSIYVYLENLITARQTETVLDSDRIDELHEKLFQAIKAKDRGQASTCAEDILNI